MTNIQLLLSIGIPSLLIVLTWINNNVRFNAIDKRLDAHDAKFERMEAKFESLQASVHKDALEIMRQMTDLHERVKAVEVRQEL